MGGPEDSEGRMGVFIRELRHNPVYRTVWLIKIVLGVLVLNLLLLLGYYVGWIG